MSAPIQGQRRLIGLSPPKGGCYTVFLSIINPIREGINKDASVGVLSVCSRKKQETHSY